MNRRSFVGCVALGLAVVIGSGVMSPASARAGGHAAPLITQRPVVFLEQVITELAANDYARAWLSLHPAHQAVAPEAEYVACEQLSPITGVLESIVPLRTRHKAVVVAGLPQAVQGVVVTFRLRFRDGELNASAPMTLTAAAVPVGRRWAWMLPRARYELYRDDACGL
jgi:hypothetical protein